jgi:transcriptional regulator with XRE-family HTH domain
MEQNIVLANRVYQLREERNMNYNDLAEKSGLPLRGVYRIAQGGVSNPGVFVMMKLCKGLGVSLDEFFGTEEFNEFR